MADNIDILDSKNILGMAFTITFILREAGSRIQSSQREFSKRNFKYQGLMGIIYFDMKLFRLGMEFDHCTQDVAQKKGNVAA